MPKPLKRAPRFQPGPTTAVAFLVTQEEYDRLKAECVPAGARSLPDLVRTRILRGITRDSLVSIARRLDELERSVRQLESRNHGASHGR